MPFRRRRPFRGTSRRKPLYRRRGIRRMPGLVPLIKRVATRNLEMKMLVTQDETTDNSGLWSGTSQVVTKLSGVTQGAGDTSRNGDSIAPVSLRFNYVVRPDVANVAATGMMRLRIILFRWRLSDGIAVPLATDIINSVGSETGAFDGPWFMDRRRNFTILADRKLQVPASVISPLYMRPHVIALRLRGRMQYEATGVLGTNQIYLMMFSNISTAADRPSVFWNARLFFKDV